MKQFEIFYANGNIASGETSLEWEAAPSDGVQVVVLLHDDGHAQERLEGHDYYILGLGNHVTGSDSMLPGYIKKGLLVSDERFKAIRASVLTKSRIWNRHEGTPWERGIRQGIPEE